MHQPSILHRAWAEIDLSALENNVRCIQEILPEHTDFMAVVKADAYGHGDAVICTALHKMGIRWFAVSNLEEALSVRQYCPDSEIFILGYTPPELAPELTKHHIIQGVMSTEYAQELAAHANGEPVRCHIKLDTGMGRIGFRSADPQACVEELLPLFALPQLKIEGLYTHFAVADCPNDAENTAYTDEQERRILAVYDLLAENGHQLQHLSLIHI